jgi:predicted transcriptional regulator
MPGVSKPNGNPVRQWRLDNGCKLERLSQMVGTSKGKLSKIENGLLHASVIIASKLSLITGIPMENIRRECPHCGRPMK